MASLRSSVSIDGIFTPQLSYIREFWLDLILAGSPCKGSLRQIRGISAIQVWETAKFDWGPSKELPWRSDSQKATCFHLDSISVRQIIIMFLDPDSSCIIREPALLWYHICCEVVLPQSAQPSKVSTQGDCAAQQWSRCPRRGVQQVVRAGGKRWKGWSQWAVPSLHISYLNGSWLMYGGMSRYVQSIFPIASNSHRSYVLEVVQRRWQYDESIDLRVPQPNVFCTQNNTCYSFATPWLGAQKWPRMKQRFGTSLRKLANACKF